MNFEPNGKEGDGEGPPTTGSYEVGYGKPPAANRFQKGRSGNPLGRPRKVQERSPQIGRGLTGQPAKKYLLDEAYRPVVVREGERTVELPAIQAVFRAMGVAAMKGNRFAQRALAELVQAVEAEDRQASIDHFKSAIDYKCNWEEAIEQARELGQPEPQPIPHPDDIIIDFVNGRASVCGPMTKEDKVDWDRLLEYRDGLQIEVSLCAADFRKSRSTERKARLLDMWKLEQKFYDRINDNLPKRYRKDLADRCWEEGATRPGQTRKRKWPGDR